MQYILLSVVLMALQLEKEENCAQEEGTRKLMEYKVPWTTWTL